MNLRTILKRIRAHTTVQELLEKTKHSPEVPLVLRGLAGSSPAFLLTIAFETLQRPFLILLEEEDESSLLRSDLEQLLGSDEHILYFPSSGRKPYDTDQIPDEHRLLQRAEVLQQLTENFDRGFMLTSIEALFERLPAPTALKQQTLFLTPGQEIAPETLVGHLSSYGYEPVEFVHHPGEFALRGGILDYFPFSSQYPIRVEFFGDEIDTLREFDPTTQRSISTRTRARVAPAPEQGELTTETSATLFDYLPGRTLIVHTDEDILRERVHSLFQQAREAHARQETPAPPPEQRYVDTATFQKHLASFPRWILHPTEQASAGHTFTFATAPQPDFGGHIQLLRQRLEQLQHKGVQTLICCDSQGQRRRLEELLQTEEDASLPCSLQVVPLQAGFEWPELSLAVYTDHQIFNRYFRPSTRKRTRSRGGLTLRELKQLKPGDYVVHIDYGIGQYAGLETITVRGKQQEAVKVLYRGNDVLYVNIHALHKLHKYKGKDGTPPRITRLGTQEWERLKSRTKRKVKDIARELITLYAQRKQSPGFAFDPDTVWQREMEASFPFDDTPDQAEATEAVKRDMEQPVPMDRLICGDVGFGKTEVAIRAAFKAVQSGKQVAVLVPTTLLAHQHYETFQERLKNYPVNIAQLSRFVPRKEQRAILQGLASGEVDIVIGTHRLVSKDVRFHDLGLLIIDEEQRFGVAVKEKLRQLRVNVDTLTLTATPIPRTLQFSLLGARDLSIINTPPPNRQPVITEIHSFNNDLIRDAILYEIHRGGQVFFLHNRVQTIEEMAQTLRRLLPGVRIQFAHGQMKPSELENIMLEFVQHHFDVLVCTNIIQNGLDIPNANTIIINHAEQFGLAELHQLRGRVGRSDRKAFCYLLTPSIHTLTKEARQRLQAVESFSELGSGFNLALRDLDIRGAGNLLGAEQSGFIAEVGFETYHRILEEAVQELREEEFGELFDTPAAPSAPEPAIDAEVDALLPPSYVSSPDERLHLYRRLSEATSDEALEDIRQEMHDRFGPLPEEAEHLLLLLRMKRMARNLRFPRVQYKRERLFLELPQQEDTYFYEQLFQPLLAALSQLEHRFVLKDQKGRVRAIIQQVPSLTRACQLLHTLEQRVAHSPEEPALNEDLNER